MKTNLKTVAEVADMLGLTHGRVRQICRKYELGRILGHDRLLAPADIRAIKSRPDGRRKKTFSKSAKSRHAT